MKTVGTFTLEGDDEALKNWLEHYNKIIEVGGSYFESFVLFLNKYKYPSRNILQSFELYFVPVCFHIYTYKPIYFSLYKTAVSKLLSSRVIKAEYFWKPNVKKFWSLLLVTFWTIFKIVGPNNANMESTYTARWS